MDVQTEFDRAVGLHRAGRTAEAIALYRSVLAAEPGRAPARHNLGALLLEGEAPEEGLTLLEQALQAAPETGAFWLSYVEALSRCGQAERARAVLSEGKQRGLAGPAVETLEARLDALSPTGAETATLERLLGEGDLVAAEAAARALIGRLAAHPLGWRALGAALARMGRTAEAETAFARGLEHSPATVEALAGVAAEAWAAGALEGAEAGYRRALALAPDRTEIVHNLGVVLRKRGRLAEAEPLLAAAAQAAPDDAAYQLVHGLVLGELGRRLEALAALDRAAALAPADPQPHLAIGVIRGETGDRARAEAAYRQALALKPDYAEATNNLGLVLFDTDRLAEAEAAYRRAIALRPNYAEAWLNLGNLQKDEARLEEARASYAEALNADPAFHKANSNLLLLDNYRPDADRARGLEAARAYGELCTRLAERRPAPPPRRRADRLRVGLVSGDLRDHPVGYFLESVVEHLDPQRIELAAYSASAEATPVTERLRRRFGLWRVIDRLGDAEAAALIRSDAIDVLIDLTGHTADHRLPMFAWRPAPVQASWLGYSNTTGVAEIDYFIGDRTIARAADQPFFTETIWALPETYLCFTPPALAIEPGPPPCLSGQPLTFGCFNNPSKLNGAVVETWSRLLLARPDARLLLKSRHYADAAFAALTRDRFAGHGVAPGRILLEGASPRPDYFAAYNRIDMVLDPFPFPGGTTTAEGLWMGAPLVTLEGDRFLARAGAGFCRNVGLADWVAPGRERYVEIALAKAGDLPALAETRRRLRADTLASPLCDAARFAAHLEDALWGMWEGRPPPPLS